MLAAGGTWGFSKLQSHQQRSNLESSKGFNKAKGTFESPDYHSPDTNPVVNDSQVTTYHHYDISHKSAPLEGYENQTLVNLKGVNHKGIVLLFVYKPNVYSSSRYQPVLNKLFNKGYNGKVSQIQLINTEQSKLTQEQFQDFCAKHSRSKLANIPKYTDVYMVLVKNDRVLDYIMKTDKDKDGMNYTNIAKMVSVASKSK